MNVTSVNVRSLSVRHLPRFNVGDYVAVKAPFLIPGLTKPGEGTVQTCGYIEALSPSLNPSEGITYWVRLVPRDPRETRHVLPCKEHELTLLLSGPNPALVAETSAEGTTIKMDPNPAPEPMLESGTYVTVTSSNFALKGTPGIEGVIEKVSGFSGETIHYYVLVDSVRPGNAFPLDSSEVKAKEGARPIPHKVMLRIVRYREPNESLKDTAHRLLEQHSQPLPGQRYEHYKGGTYEVVAVSVDEETLEPLITYKSLKLGTFTTRTRENFLERVKSEKSGCVVGRPRFMRILHSDPTPNRRSRFAVVNTTQMPKRFTVWHTSYSAASKEAERLAKQFSGTPFSVLSESATVQSKPVEYKTEWSGDHPVKLESEEEPEEIPF
jgi:hypothetical protein